jgi:hypothetical protein
VLRLVVQRLEAERGVYVIVDSHPVHRSGKARDWVQAQGGRVRLVFLPGYSPDLNPDEMLNQDVKANAGGRGRPRNQEDMIGTVRSYLHSRQKQPYIVRNYFHEKSVRYAAM